MSVVICYFELIRRDNDNLEPFKKPSLLKESELICAKSNNAR